MLPNKKTVINKRYVFLGNMNNMAFFFARAMKQKGYDVTLLVDAAPEHALERPESFDHYLSANYPSWIQELSYSRHNLYKLILTRFFFRKLLKRLNSYDTIVLNKFWICLAPFLKKEKKIIFFSAGYELFWADPDSLPGLINEILGRRRYVKPFAFIIKIIYRNIINKHRIGIKRVDGINAYPTGITPKADAIITDLKKDTPYKQLQLRGFPYDNISIQSFNDNKTKFNILNFTRFNYLNGILRDKNEQDDNKRNDIMIEGIAAFIKSNCLDNTHVEIIFFNKGTDVNEAKELCEKTGINKFITWKEQVSQQDLNIFIRNCDVAFDQLGNHWIGYGIVSMLFGRPLIANARPEIFENLLGEASPVCQATTIKEVADWLTILYNDKEVKQRIGEASSKYIRKHYDINKTIDFIVNT